MIAASKVVRGTATSLWAYDVSLCSCGRVEGQVSGVVMPQAVSRSESAMFICRSLGIGPNPLSISVWLKFLWRYSNSTIASTRPYAINSQCNFVDNIGVTKKGLVTAPNSVDVRLQGLCAVFTALLTA